MAIAHLASGGDNLIVSKDGALYRRQPSGDKPLLHSGDAKTYLEAARIKWGMTPVVGKDGKHPEIGDGLPEFIDGYDDNGHPVLRLK